MRARELIMEHGWNTTCYQLLNPGMQHWFPASNDALIGYVTHGGVRVVAGAPVCTPECSIAVAHEFEHCARKQGERVCFFAAEERFGRQWQHNTRCVRVALGAQPVWDPQQWSDNAGQNRNVRTQLNRARNRHVHVQEWPVKRARECPELQSVHASWLKGHGLPPLRFLGESDILGCLEGRRIFVAESAFGVEGFIVTCPIPARNGWLAELIVRRPTAPNGTSEAMVHQAACLLAASGASRFTLGLAPLAHLQNGPTSDPVWLRLFLRWMRAHGRRFYNFRGLEYFKSKFCPAEWQPVYALLSDRRASPRDLYAIAGAFAGGSPLSLIATALASAVHEEWRSLTQPAT